jgi:hypothetical protein
MEAHGECHGSPFFCAAAISRKIAAVMGTAMAAVRTLRWGWVQLHAQEADERRQISERG